MSEPVADHDPKEEVRIVLGDHNGTPWRVWTFTREQLAGDMGSATLAMLLRTADSEEAGR